MPPRGLLVARALPEQPAKSGEEVQREQREREASRPYHQFVYQLSKERERIQEQITPPRLPRENPMTQAVVGLERFHHRMEAYKRRKREGSPGNEPAIFTPPDINTTAYERVKSAWIKRRIWNAKWGVLPGMSWKHEQPFEEMLQEERGDGPGAEGARIGDGNQQRDSGGVAHDAAETNGDGARKIHPRPRLFSPDQHVDPSSQRLGSCGLDRLVQVQQTSLGMSPPPLTGGEDGNSPVTPDPDDAPGSSQTSRCGIRRTQPRRRAAESTQPGPRTVKPAAPKPVRPARVSKAHKPRPRARSDERKEPSEVDAPAEAGTSMAKPEVGEPGQLLADAETDIPPRRSRRLQASSEDKLPAAADGLPDRRSAVRRSTRRTSAGAAKSAAAKPEGITKRRSRNRRRREAG